ncbi:hypothetical protein N9K16_01565 [Alphaproteobacteria bacterium]|nr:hypothetical protein [Alphaproteobacteria bacterium]
MRLMIWVAPLVMTCAACSSSVEKYATETTCYALNPYLPIHASITDTDDTLWQVAKANTAFEAACLEGEESFSRMRARRSGN